MYRARWMLCAIAAALVSTGCALVPIDLDGRGCPCGPGWRCDIASGACQRCLAVEECGDGGVDVLASVCDRPTPSRLFCAGFERSLESEFAGIQHSEGGRAEIVSAPVHRGAGAGLTSSDGADAPSYDSFTQWGVPLPEVIHATFWVRREALPETPASGGTAISFFSVATEHHERFFNVAMFQSGELIVIMQPVTTTGYTSRQIPIGEWNCLRFELHGENPGSARAWFVDATHEAEQELAIGWTGPRPDMRFETPYQQISVGPSYNVLPIGLVFDDIAVGSEPQPCR